MEEKTTYCQWEKALSQFDVCSALPIELWLSVHFLGSLRMYFDDISLGVSNERHSWLWQHLWNTHEIAGIT